VITGSVVTTILKAFVIFPATFVALTVKLDIPVVVGVPEINPVFVFKLNPAGKTPYAIAQVIGVVPLADRV
jgi:hypothetical protein